MGRSKAFRRFKELLKKIWAKKIIKTRTADIPNYIITNKEIGRVAHTPQSCSCEICGNPRHHRGSKKDQLTIQERKKLDHFNYYDDTYYDDENPI
jgi:hypothetical protein